MYPAGRRIRGSVIAESSLWLLGTVGGLWPWTCAKYSRSLRIWNANFLGPVAVVGKVGVRHLLSYDAVPARFYAQELKNRSSPIMSGALFVGKYVYFPNCRHVSPSSATSLLHPLGCCLWCRSSLPRRLVLIFFFWWTLCCIWSIDQVFITDFKYFDSRKFGLFVSEWGFLGKLSMVPGFLFVCPTSMRFYFLCVPTFLKLKFKLIWRSGGV